ncbi:MAG: hypothetical protein NT062_22100 [Proteobacteria bacterium]|nr:hypothetical protein [Pseudomonadota bacterium]
MSAASSSAWVSSTDAAPWAKLRSLAALRYHGTGWWLDRVLPRSPIGLLVAALALPFAWFGVGLAVADDRAAFAATPDVVHQLWFFPLHLICLRLVGGLWARGLDPSLDGLAMGDVSKRRIRLGALGTWASVGAIVACAGFIGRDFWFGLTPDPGTGLIPFDDPDLWDMAKLGRGVHGMMLGLWTLEWLLFGYLLWLQVWVLFAWTRELRRADFRPHLLTVLVGDGYRHAFTLFGKTASVCALFALGNLAFIRETGELIPRDKVVIADLADFLQNMSDVLSTTLLFVFAIAAVVAFVTQLRNGMTRAVNAEFLAAGNTALADLAVPIVRSGDAEVDLARLQARVDAQAGLVRAVVFQREADKIGGRTIISIGFKALLPIITTILKIAKMQVKGG